MSQLNFGMTMDATNAPDRMATDALPAGLYPASPVNLEVKNSKDGNAMAVACQFQIIDGPLQGRMIFDNFMTVAHKTSAKAHDIGQRRFKEWCEAIGIPPVQSSLEPFIGKAVMVRVLMEKATPYVDSQGIQKPGAPKNRIDGFKRHEAAAPSMPQLQRPTASGAPPSTAPAPAPVPAIAVPAAPAAPRTAPWQRPR